MNVMERLLINPNLPEGFVKKVVIGTADIDTLNSLRNIGITTKEFTDRTNVRTSVSSHADIHFCHLDEKTVIISNHQKHMIDEIKDIYGLEKIITEETPIEYIYPKDVLLNCVFVGKYVIYNEKTISNNIKQFINEKNFIKIKVKQGYTKCSVAVVNDKAIITDDKQIANKSVQHGLEALFVSKGSVILNGYNYGFIGGCCGKIGKNVIAFNGDIKKHTDYIKICEFLKQHQICYVSLKEGALEDIGSILPLTEEL